jgi:hypothetical protein
MMDSILKPSISTAQWISLHRFVWSFSAIGSYYICFRKCANLQNVLEERCFRLSQRNSHLI